MDKEDIIKYLTDNMSIEIEQKIDFSPKSNLEEIIKVKLILGDDVISEDTCRLP